MSYIYGENIDSEHIVMILEISPPKKDESDRVINTVSIVALQELINTVS